MAGKKLPKNIDLTKNLNPADGFFSSPAPAKVKYSDKESEKINSPAEADLSRKNVGGRPQKKGLLNEQFTLTMHPELYEKLRLIAQEQTGGNVSALIEVAIKTYCKENKINLDKMKVAPAVLETYQKKQEKKRAKKK